MIKCWPSKIGFWGVSGSQYLLTTAVIMSTELILRIHAVCSLTLT